MLRKDFTALAQMTLVLAAALIHLMFASELEYIAEFEVKNSIDLTGELWGIVLLNSGSESLWGMINFVLSCMKEFMWVAMFLPLVAIVFIFVSFQSVLGDPLIIQREQSRVGKIAFIWVTWGVISLFVSDYANAQDTLKPEVHSPMALISMIAVFNGLMLLNMGNREFGGGWPLGFFLSAIAIVVCYQYSEMRLVTLDLLVFALVVLTIINCCLTTLRLTLFVRSESEAYEQIKKWCIELYYMVN